MSKRRIVLTFIWVSFVAYTLILAPLDQPGNLTLIAKLIKLEWGDVNAYIFAIFSLMGVWPLIYACLIFADSREQEISAWPAFITSNGSGVIGLLPYLIARKSNQEFTHYKGLLLKILDSRLMGIALAVSTLGLLVYAFGLGDWQEYGNLWRTNAFVHLITWDFCLMCVLFPSVLGDDMERRGWQRNSQLFWLISLVPLLGPLLYLCIRPPLPERKWQSEVSYE